MPAMAQVSSAKSLQLDWERLRMRFLAKCRHGVLTEDDMYVDVSFPPDITSLSYVYSGDDKYERMVFKRPKVRSQNNSHHIDMIMSVDPTF